MIESPSEKVLEDLLDALAEENLDRSLRAIKMLALWLESDGEFPCIYDVNKSEGVWRIGGF